ncbi:MAG: hypothetical protein ACFB15_07645 [Cyclobacteriaceae bacterium]
MINEEDKTDIIDQYLAGTLDGELQLEVEDRINTDAEFRREVALQQKIIRNVRNRERESIRNELAELFTAEYGKQKKSETEEATIEDEAKVIPFYRRQWFSAIAASVAFALIAGLTIWYTTETDDTVLYAGKIEVQKPRSGDIPPSVPDSLQVQIITDNDQYNFHYQFEGQLILYGDFRLDSVKLLYDSKKQQYLLEVERVYYPLEETEEITELSAEVQ